MRINFLILTLIVGFTTYSQSVYRISEKVTEEICKCMDSLPEGETLTSAYSTCEEQVLSKMGSFLSKEELEVIEDPLKMSSLKKGLLVQLNQNCDVLQTKFNLSSTNKSESFPVGVNGDQYVNLSNFENKTITVGGTISKVVKFNGETYFEITSENALLFAKSMVISGYETLGNKVKLMGTVVPITSHQALTDLQNGKTHQLNVYGIVDLKSMDFAYFPGTENKMSAWRNGTLPD